MDFVPAADSSSYETAVQRAEQFIIDRFVKPLPSSITAPVVHIIKVPRPCSAASCHGWHAVACTHACMQAPANTAHQPGSDCPASPLPCSLALQSEVDTESVGHVLCKKADELDAVAIVMASHSKGRMAEFFLGSVTQYCTHHSKRPVVIVPASR